LAIRSGVMGNTHKNLAVIDVSCSGH